MRTKVSTLCERAIEAGWLLAVILVPLFFNVYSSRVFEPDKIAILRSIAVLMGLAWIIQWAEERLGARGSAHPQQGGALDRFVRTPLIAPALLLACVYILATITSVIPRVSLWGSYQRMQGTFTSLSYLLIFVLIVLKLRRPAQLQRLQTAIILTSLPIALYSLLQRYSLDPLPWAGDVTFRVASNMGNAIFVGAYFIMVVPLTLARVWQMQTSALNTQDTRQAVAFGVAFWVALAVVLGIWAVAGFGVGLAIALLFVLALVLTAALLHKPMPRFLLLGCYSLILVAQVLTVFFSQSRGPQIGLIAGLGFFVLLLAFVYKRRALLTLIVVAVPLFMALLVAVNVLVTLPNSPLQGIPDIPYVGRLARLFETDRGTGKVRLLIWEGAADMLRADPVRTIIGYGPESMYVAYNPFYPPDLAHYERRNASPDRAHNETFDALITTGVLGFVVYVFLFSSIFYYVLRWLGLMHTRKHKIAFGLSLIIGALLGVLLPWLLDGSLRLMGVGLPVGLVVGLFAYMAVAALASVRRSTDQPDGEERPQLEDWRLLLMVALFAAIIAHYFEIQVGIAIVSTRTYFWVFAALLVVLGHRVLPADRPLEGAQPEVVLADGGHQARGETAKSKTRRERASGSRSAALASELPARVSAMRGQLVALALVGGVILATMVWDYTVNTTDANTSFKVLFNSLATMAGKRMPERISLGMAWIFLTTLAVSMFVSVAELIQNEPEDRSAGWWLRAFGLFILIAGGIGGLYGVIHAAKLLPNKDITNLIYEYYVVIGLIWVTLTVLLFVASSRPRQWTQGAVGLAYPVLLVGSLLLVNQVNINVVRADVVYKQGLRPDAEGKWEAAAALYDRAREMVPTEDFYHLYYGRAWMERARLESNPQVRDAYFSEAVASLERARELAPLNTDHTANLARLYRTWAESSQDPEVQREKLELALNHYAAATKLSPANAQLVNEWGLVYHILGDFEQALARYQESLALDQEFGQTYLLIGDVYFAQGNWPQAVSFYEWGINLDPSSIQGWSSLAYGYAQLGQMDKAITANLQILTMVPDDYVTLKNLAILYKEKDQPAEALAYAEKAAAVAPEQEQAIWQGFIQELQAPTEENK
ncbi:MAG: tetratricopeptide repeat protein [Chloroflexi bacterium]|jgi:tetratricopeptide (TPR) repeat protein/O-antigen ligase|nr:tetratricopeptide repeat protein [Chloroflexota bacterium]